MKVDFTLSSQMIHCFFSFLKTYIYILYVIIVTNFLKISDVCINSSFISVS